MALSIFCNPSVPDFVQKQCGTELGGIVSLSLIDVNIDPSLTDLTTLSWWTQKLAATPQHVWVIKDTRGSYAGGTPTEEDGFGRVPTLRTGADHEANVESRGVVDNRTFWASVNQNAKWNAVLFTNGLSGHYIQDVSVYAKQVIDQSIKSSIRMSANLKWSDDMSNPLVFDASALLSIIQ